MDDYRRTSPTEWTWHDDDRQRAVRLFNSTRRLIWSGWVETDNGPVYDDGISQSYDAFALQGAPDHLHVPPELVDLLRQRLSQDDANRHLRGRFCNG
ncbi:MAG: hypothetical protein IT320_15730 [Anaerolineae bacterium]|nr:hypothetical protein [Anaerolineae bacterium]